MLDLNHPQTRFVFGVAGCADAILSLAKKMTLVDTARKIALLAQSKRHLDEMRRLAIEAWDGSLQLTSAIDALENSLTTFAAVPSTNDFASDWQGKKCTVCGRQIEDAKGYEDMVYCRGCMKHFDMSMEAVDEAFGLDAI